MALDTYTNLQVEIGEWLNRQDLTTKIPTFISLLEAQVERALRVRQMITRATATISEDYTDLPDDFLALHNVQLLTEPTQPMQYVTNSEIANLRATYGANRPRWYTILGDAIEVAPSPDDSYEMEIIYYAQIPRLSATQASNWLLASHPDVYLFGSLVQAAPYLDNDERIPTWGGALGTILEDMRIADERGQKGGVPLRMRIKPY